ncbi:putative ribonuclease H-like domain-containing protein [Tanacetum coccineum]
MVLILLGKQQLVLLKEMGSLLLRPQQGNPQQALKYKGMFDSGYSRHMAGNKALLTDYQEIDGGFIAFGGSTRGGKITGPQEANGDTGLKKNVDFGQTEEKNESTQQYIVFPLWSSISSSYKRLDDKTGGDTPDDVAGKKTVQELASEYDQALKNILDKMMDQEKEATEHSAAVRHEFEAQCDSQLLQEKATRTSSTNSFNTVSTPVNAASAPRTSNDEATQSLCKTKHESSNSQPFQDVAIWTYLDHILRIINKRPNLPVVTETLVARTMLADLLLPTVFWAEAVNTACYVLNRVLVTKPHNKTPYELIIGRAPSISFMRPFRCPITILNTLDPLGKFDGKAEEGFLVGYFVNSKAFNVFNSQTKKVKENLHVNFLENKPNVAGQGPNWLYNIDSLTNSMNYRPVTTGNQTNKNAGLQEANGNTSLKESVDVGQSKEMNVSTQQYIVFPLWSSISSNYKSSDDKAEDDTVDDDACKKTVQEPTSEYDQALKNVLAKMLDQEKEATDTPVNTASASRTFSHVRPSSGPSFVPFGRPFPIDVSNLPHDPLMPELEDIAKIQSTCIFGNAYDDHDLETLNTPYADQSVGAEARMHNMGTFHYSVQTRGMTKKNSGEHAMISCIQKQRRTNHKDFHNCLFACFLSQHEPTKIHQALDDESWVEPMQEELLQFKIQKVSDEFNGRTYFLLEFTSQAERGWRTTIVKTNINVSVCACSRFQVQPKVSHLNAVKRIFRYLKGQPKLGLWYHKDSPLILCKKQIVVANSTTKAEYIAASHCCEEPETLRYLSLVVPLKKVGDEAVHKELGDKMERVATTASSLEVEQDSGRVTSLFESMLVQHQAPEGEVSVPPPDPHPTPSTSQPVISEPQSEPLQTETPLIVSHEPQTEVHIEQILPSLSTYQRKQRKTQKHRRTKKGTELPQTSVPLDHGPDEAVNKDGSDSVERAITTDASLVAAQVSGSPRRQDTIRGAPAQTTSERVPTQPNKPPLPEGHTSRSREGRMGHYVELMDPVPPTPQDLPLLGGYTLDAQVVEILRLKKRVKRLERKRKSNTSQPRRRKYRQVLSFDDDLDEEDASKQGRTSDKTKPMFKESDFDDVDDLVDEGMAFVQEKDAETVDAATTGVSTVSAPVNADGMKEKGVAIKDVKDSSRPVRSITTLQPLPSIDPKDKGKGVLVEEERVKVKKRDQGLAQIESDAELAQRLYEEDLAEEERRKSKRAAQEEASMAAIYEEYDTIQASIDADALFAAKLQQEDREQYTIKERAKFLVETITAQRKFRAA